MNWWRLMCAVAFYLHQNTYFGWHRWPTTPAEVVVDGITLVLLSLAITGNRHDAP